VSFRRVFEIRRQVSRTTRIALGVTSWAIVILAWYLLTESRVLPALVLPDPAAVVRAFNSLWTDYNLPANIFKSWWRIAQAFLWSAAIAIPLGLLMGSFRWLYALINPVAAPMRSMPITAFLPAFMGLFGIDELEKIAFLWLGMFFYLLAVVVEEVNRVDQALIETTLTLGAKHRHVLWLMFRASFPAVFGSFRILYDLGWTYVILAEMVNAREGVGYMIDAAQKNFRMPAVFAGIVAIGIAAFLFRWLLTMLEKVLFPWRRPARTISAPIKVPTHAS
jgi:NitT/TauT family transport system permease protein